MQPRLRLYALFLFLGTILLFGRALGYGFLNYDDPDYVAENALVQGGLGWAAVQRAFTTPVMGNYHPVTMLSYVVDWELSGGNPAFFHLTNFLWHAVNAVLVLVLFRQLGLSKFVALFAAALFAWHPLRVESVVWIAERKDVLSGFFFLVTLLTYLAYRRRRAAGVSPWGWYAAALGAAALGLLSKPMLVTLPAVLLLVDFLLWSRESAADGTVVKPIEWRAAGRAVLEKLPFLVLSVACGLATMATQQGAIAAGRGLADGVPIAIAALPQYLWKTVWPTNLAPLYPIPDRAPQAWMVAGIGLLVVVLGLAAWQWRRRAWLAVGWLWFLGMLVPVLGLIQVGVQAMADRYTYLPTLGLLLMVGFAVDALAARLASRGARIAFTATALAVVAASVWLAARQVGRWRDPITLWEHTVACTAENPVGRMTLGGSYLAAGRFAEAERELRRAVTVAPKLQMAHTNLGIALALQGRPREALASLEAAEALGVRSPKLLLNMARLLISLDRRDEAAAKCRLVLARWPGLPAAQSLLAEALGQSPVPVAPGR
jgi:hypothetical protein